MTQSTPHSRPRGVRLGDLELDEDRWRKLFELAEDDRRDPRAYALIVVESHIDRHWPRLARKKGQAG
jgi:hypothetical protein